MSCQVFCIFHTTIHAQVPKSQYDRKIVFNSVFAYDGKTKHIPGNTLDSGIWLKLEPYEKNKVDISSC